MLIPQITAIPGVTAVAGQLVTFVATDNDDRVIAVGWPEDSFYWPNVPLQEGRLPHKGERRFALLGNEIARALQKRVGDSVTLLGEQFFILGITHYASLINRNEVIVDLADLQDLTFRPGAVTFLSIKLDHPRDAEEAARIFKRIESIGQLSVSSSEDVLRNDSLLGLLSAISTSMASVALLMGVLMVLNTLLMAVLERTREIGILSAIGWSKKRIMLALVIEGFILSGAR